MHYLSCMRSGSYNRPEFQWPNNQIRSESIYCQLFILPRRKDNKAILCEKGLNAYAKRIDSYHPAETGQGDMGRYFLVSLNILRGEG